MLTEIKDRATGWLAWVIVILISIPFALWGVNEYFAGGSSVTVAKVDGVEIDEQTYRRELDQERQRLQQLLGSSLTPGYLNSTEFRQGVLDGIIDRVLLTQYAHRQGYRIGDEILAERLRTFPSFQRDGRFDNQAYRAFLAQSGYSATGFESELRNWVAIDQVSTLMAEGSFVTDRQREQALRLAAQTRFFQQVVLSPELFIDAIEVDEAAARAEYDSDPERFALPEQVRIDYVRLSIDDLARRIDLDEADLLRYYEANRNRWRTEGVRRASHILLPFPSGMEEAERDGLRLEAEALAERIDSGEEFAEIAREYSGDPGSASAGGDLGPIFEGAMDPAFERALNALELGQVSEPVRTRFGYHLIKLTQFESDIIQPFEEVRSEIERTERRRLAEERFLDFSEELRNVTFEQPDSLDPAADFLDLEVRTSDWFSREGGQGITSQPVVVNAAFSDDVFLAGLNSEVIEIGTNDLVALRKHDEQPARVPEFAEVRDEVEALLRQRLAEERAQAVADEALERLNADPNAWGEVVAELPVEVESREIVRASLGQSQRDAALLNSVFRLPPPVDGVPRHAVVSGERGAIVVVRLERVDAGDPEVLSDTARERVTRALEERWGAQLFEGHLRGLRETMPIEVQRREADEALML